MAPGVTEVARVVPVEGAGVATDVLEERAPRQAIRDVVHEAVLHRAQKSHQPFGREWFREPA
eukprot:6969057-Pyramimonas_sp.AAC.1